MISILWKLISNEIYQFLILRFIEIYFMIWVFLWKLMPSGTHQFPALIYVETKYLWICQYKNLLDNNIINWNIWKEISNYSWSNKRIFWLQFLFIINYRNQKYSHRSERYYYYYWYRKWKKFDLSESSIYNIQYYYIDYIFIYNIDE